MVEFHCGAGAPPSRRAGRIGRLGLFGLLSVAVLGLVAVGMARASHIHAFFCVRRLEYIENDPRGAMQQLARLGDAAQDLQFDRADLSATEDSYRALYQLCDQAGKSVEAAHDGLLRQHPPAAMADVHRDMVDSLGEMGDRVGGLASRLSYTISALDALRTAKAALANPTSAGAERTGGDAFNAEQPCTDARDEVRAAHRALLGLIPPAGCEALHSSELSTLEDISNLLGEMGNAERAGQMDRVNGLEARADRRLKSAFDHTSHDYRVWTTQLGDEFTRLGADAAEQAARLEGRLRTAAKAGSRRSSS
jgi:hypothetical protein